MLQRSQPVAGTVDNPNYAPCYCSPSGEDGISACFDFNGATSDVSCNPSGICTLSTAQPGSFGIQEGGPIYLVSLGFLLKHIDMVQGSGVKTWF